MSHEGDKADLSSHHASSRSPARRSWSRWLVTAALVAGIAGFYTLGLDRYLSWEHLRSHLDAWRAQVRQHLFAAAVIYFLAYATATALSLPLAAGLSLAAGALFDLWLAAGIVDLAATLGATLAFLASRYLFRDWVQRRFGARLQALDEGVRRDGAWYLLSLRLVPLVPYFLINLGMGLTPMRTRTFAVVSLIGMLPGVWLYTNAGYALGTLASPRDVLSPQVLAALALLGVVPLAIRLLLHRQQR